MSGTITRIWRTAILAVAVITMALLGIATVSTSQAEAVPSKDPRHSAAKVTAYWMGTVRWSWSNSDGKQVRTQDIAGGVELVGAVVDDHGTIVTSNLGFNKKYWGVVPAIDAEWDHQFHTPEGETPWTDEMVAGHTVTNVHLVGIAVTSDEYPNGVPSEYKLVDAQKLGDSGNFAVIKPKQAVKTKYFTPISDGDVKPQGRVYYVTERGEGGAQEYKLQEPWAQAGPDKYQFTVSRARATLVGGFVVNDGNIVGMVNGQYDDAGMNYLITNGRMADYVAKHGVKVKRVSPPAPEPTATPTQPSGSASPTVTESPSVSSSPSATTASESPSAAPQPGASVSGWIWGVAAALGLALAGLITALVVVAKRSRNSSTED